MQEVETVLDQCKHLDCVYRGRLNGSGTPFCQYIMMEHKSRGCPISECDKYKSGAKTQPRMTSECMILWEYEIYEDADTIGKRLVEDDI